MIKAAFEGNERAIRRLLREGADIKLLKFLLKEGANASIKDKYGVVSLTSAAMSGNVNSIEVLLDAGVDIDEQSCGNTALMISSRKGHTAVVKLLLKRGSDASVRAKEDCTTLLHAGLGGHSQIITMLLDAGACVDEADEYGRTALIAAASKAHTSAVVTLLERGFNVNLADVDGKNALHTAAEEGFDEIVEVLIKFGADLERTTTSDHYAPLHYTACMGHHKCAWLLIRAGAKVSANKNHPSQGFYITPHCRGQRQH